MPVKSSLAAVTAAVLFTLGGPHAYGALNVNLIQNPGAEADVGNSPSSPGTSPNITITAWEIAATDTPAAAQRYDGVSGPNGYQPQPTLFTGGNNYFYGGNSVVNGFSSSAGGYAIRQTASLTDIASVIDAGGAAYNLQGYFGGYQNQNDLATLSVEFFNAASGSLGTASVGGVTPADRANATTLLFRQTSGTIPALARSATFSLGFTNGGSGTYADGSADNLSFTVIPEPASLALLAVPAVALMRRRTA